MRQAQQGVVNTRQANPNPPPANPNPPRNPNPPGNPNPPAGMCNSNVKLSLEREYRDLSLQPIRCVWYHRTSPGN